MDYKKYLPIGIVIIVIAYLLRKNSGGGVQVINRGVDFTQNKTSVNNRDAAQVSAFSQLASAAVGIENIGQRNNQAMLSLEAEKVRGNTQISMASILANSRGYDIAQQLSAQDAISKRVYDAQNRQATLAGIGSILSAIGKLGQQSQGAKTTPPISGGSGSSIPSLPSAGNRTNNSQASRTRVGDWVSRNLSFLWSTPAEYNYDTSYLGSLNYPELSYPNEYDYWSNTGWSYEPTGTVTSSFEPTGLAGGNWWDNYSDWDFDPLNYQSTYGD